LRRNKQRPGRESDPVAEIRQLRRSQQPAETATKTRWRDELGELVHYDRPTSEITTSSNTGYRRGLQVASRAAASETRSHDIQHRQ
jgi:hypothetical protein